MSGCLLGLARRPVEYRLCRSFFESFWRVSDEGSVVETLDGLLIVFQGREMDLEANVE